jgi:hypothetical protein
MSRKGFYDLMYDFCGKVHDGGGDPWLLHIQKTGALTLRVAIFGISRIQTSVTYRQRKTASVFPMQINRISVIMWSSAQVNLQTGALVADHERNEALPGTRLLLHITHHP